MKKKIKNPFTEGFKHMKDSVVADLNGFEGGVEELSDLANQLLKRHKAIIGVNKAVDFNSDQTVKEIGDSIKRIQDYDITILCAQLFSGILPSLALSSENISNWVGLPDHVLTNLIFLALTLFFIYEYANSATRIHILNHVEKEVKRV